MMMLIRLWLFLAINHACLAQQSSVVNNYAPVTDICGLLYTLKDASGFHKGDSILIIQMKGAQPVKENNSSFGNIEAIGSAGHYGFNKIADIIGNVVVLKYKPERTYDVSGMVQLITVPYWGDIVTGNLTCLPWDGEKGGVLVFTAGQVVLSGDIDVTGKGFRPGILASYADDGCPADDTNFFLPESNYNAGQKGEGIVNLTIAYARAAGRAGNGGGGGNDHNNGGGGGGNGGKGGSGGHWDQCNGYGLLGKGGLDLSYYYTPARNRVFMGGGGGAGHDNENHGTSGGYGGGIVIISAKEIHCQGYFIKANGAPTPLAIGDDDGAHDGGGGGGGGGSVLVSLANPGASDLKIQANGSNGGKVRDDHGQGGGGGGGMILLNSSLMPGWNLSAEGGSPGLGEPKNGSTPGLPGKTRFDLVLYADTLERQPLEFFKAYAIPECDGTATIVMETKGATGTTLYSVNHGASFQPSGVFKNLTAGIFPIAAKDNCVTIYGSVEAITYPPLTIDPFLQPFRCDSLGSLELNASGGKGLLLFHFGSRPWQHKSLFKDVYPGIYAFEVIDERACFLRDTFEVIDSTAAIPLTALPDTCIIKGDSIVMREEHHPAYQAIITNYTWKPGFGLSEIDIPNPVFKLEETVRFTLTVHDQFGCIGHDDVEVKVRDDDVYFANVFWPNDINLSNRVFMPEKGLREALVNRFAVYNRFGDEIFVRKNFMVGDSANAWDGSFNGKLMNPGVFIYYAEIEFMNGKRKIYKGDVTLVH